VWSDSVNIIVIIGCFIIGSIISAVSLWCGMKLTKVQGTFLGMMLIAAVSGLCGLIPAVGAIVALIVMFFLISKFTDAQFWPDAVLMVVVANVLYNISILAIPAFLASLMSS
jgi:hypothetical protein